uniref:NYD-SP28_assoc domain-containing protein n=2 Tax=Globodera pallida TaxID=36090 RepID=A0A183BIQ1_GLOPA
MSGIRNAFSVDLEIWCRHGQQLDMDKSGNNTPNGSNIQMASPKAIAWAIQTLGGCERALCCKVALDADKYFKAFKECQEKKKHNDAQLERHEQMWTAMVQQVSLLQTVFSRDAQEKEALRAENDGLRGQNILLNAEVFRLKTIIEKCQIVPKSGAVPNVVKKGPPLALAEKRQSTGGDDESTSVAAYAKRIKESGPTTTMAPSAAAVVANGQQKSAALPPVVANAKHKPSVPPVVAKDQHKPMQATKNAKNSSSHSNVLEDFWQAVKEDEQAVLRGWTTARALVEHFLITYPPFTVLEHHQNSPIRHNVLRFADSIFAFVHQNNALPPLKIKDHQFFVEK